MANVTSWNAKAFQCFIQPDDTYQAAHLACVTEHRISASRFWATQELSAGFAGWALSGSFQKPQTRAPSMHRTKSGPNVWRCVGFSRVWVRWQSTIVLVVPLYIKVGESLLAGVNRETMAEWASLLRSIDAAWIVGTTRVNCVKLSLIGTVRVISLSLPSRPLPPVLFWNFFSKRLANKAKCRVEYSAPWRPHYNAVFSLDLTVNALRLPCLTKRVPLPACVGPRLPWGSFQKVKAKMCAPMRPRGKHCSIDLDEKFACFVAQFEERAMSTVTDVERLGVGQGRILDINVAELDTRKAPAAVWRDKDVGFWSTLHRWTLVFGRLRSCARLDVGSLKSQVVSNCCCSLPSCSTLDDQSVILRRLTWGSMSTHNSLHRPGPSPCWGCDRCFAV